MEFSDGLGSAAREDALREARRRRLSVGELFAEAAVNHKHTLKKIWKPPVLHRDTKMAPHEMFIKHGQENDQLSTHENHHRSEIWYELFFDLIFVAACTQLSHLIEHDTSWYGLFQSGMLFIVLRSTWESLIFYQNRFDTKDLLHYFFYLYEAICAYVIAEHFTISEESGRWDVHRNMRTIAYAAAAARLGQSLMYTQLMCLTKLYSKHLFALCNSQRLAAGIYLLSAVLPFNEHYYYVFWILAEVVERSAVMLYLWLRVDGRDAQSVRIPWHFEHLIHREGTFILLVLGEAIILLVQRKMDNDLTDIMFGILSFASVFNVGDLYYQQQVVGYRHFKEKKTKTPSFMWIELHELLALSTLFFGVGINLVYANSRNGGGIRDLTEELLMCSGASISLTVIYILRVAYKGIRGSGSSNVKHRVLSYAFRFAVSIGIALIPYFSPNDRWTIVILFVATIVLILQDLATHLVLERDVDDGRASFTSGGTGTQEAAAPLLTGDHAPADLSERCEMDGFVPSSFERQLHTSK